MGHEIAPLERRQIALERGGARLPVHPPSRNQAVALIHSTAGNLSIARVMVAHGIRAKLTVSEPGDATEQEADRVADAVVSRKPIRTIQRTCAGCAGGQPCEACEDDVVQRRASPGHPSTSLAEVIASLSESRGQLLDGGMRREYEAALDADLSSVRVHTDSHAQRASRAVSAHAFTMRRDIYFAANRFQPHTTAGRELLAHELTHVVQAGEATPSRSREHRRPVPKEKASAAIQRQWEIIPELGRFGPEAGRIGPELGRIGPDAGRFAPEMGRVAPEMGRAGTEVGRPAPSGGTSPNPLVRPYRFPPVLPQPLPQTRPQEPEERDPRCGTPGLPRTNVTFSPGPLGQGRYVKASPLSKCPGNTIGSEPDNRIYRPQFDCITANKQRGSWVRAHLLHGRTSSSGPFNLHGPGDKPENLIIADQSLNQQMRRGAEAQAIARVWGGGEVMWYESRVDAYGPGLDFFAQTITVRYGHYDTASKSEGAQDGGGTFALSKTPPNCPAAPGGGTAAAPASAPQRTPQGAPAAMPAAPESVFAFQSTLRICMRELTSHVFRVRNGGLEVRIEADWHDAAGTTVRPRTECPITDYTVTLEQAGRLWGYNQVGDPVKVEVGKGETFWWRHLEDDDYRLRIRTTNQDPTCCLQGDIIVSTFSTPRTTGGPHDLLIA